MADDLDFDPEGKRLPITIDTTTNGEFYPQPLTANQKAAIALAHERVDEAASRTGLSRRRLLTGAAGFAVTALAIGDAHARAGAPQGIVDIPRDAAFDQQLAQASVTIPDDVLVVDIQMHCVDDSGAWAHGRDGEIWKKVLTQIFTGRDGYTPFSADEGETVGFDRYNAEHLVEEVFVRSPTRAGVISALWGLTNPTPIEYAREAAHMINSLGGKERVWLHGGVIPNHPDGFDAVAADMEEKAGAYDVKAWKIYKQWGSEGIGYYLDGREPSRDFARPFIEKARDLGVKVVCAHVGLPLPGLERAYADPSDVPVVARQFPDVTFMCYHAGFDPAEMEGPFDAALPLDQIPIGTNRLIRAYLDQGYRPNDPDGNVYAELGSVFWQRYTRSPEEAAHLLGKLLRYFGEDRIVWGTDSIWWGSPTAPLQAFWTLQIPSEMQEKYGYPPLTETARRKILGLNAAGPYGLDTKLIMKASLEDPIRRRREAFLAHPNPSFRTYGPKTAEQVDAHRHHHGGWPA